MSDFEEGKEIARTASYLVLSRRRGTLLFGQLVSNRERIERLERRNDALAESLAEQSNLLVHALHDLAMSRGSTDPQVFMRRWIQKRRAAEKGVGLPS